MAHPVEMKMAVLTSERKPVGCGNQERVLTNFPMTLRKADLTEALVPEEGVEPTQSKAPADFESAASASSATPG